MTAAGKEIIIIVLDMLHRIDVLTEADCLEAKETFQRIHEDSETTGDDPCTAEQISNE